MSSPSPTKTVKQRLLEQQGQKAPLDLFLFACWEQEKTLKALARDAQKEKKSFVATPPRGWPGVQTAASDGTRDFGSLWVQCCQWYKTHYPDLASSLTLDHETLSGLVAPVVDLYNDLNALFQLCFEKSLPVFPAVEGAEESPWPQILKVLETNVGSVNGWVREYLIWSFREEVVEFFEHGSRPPVGKYAPPALRRESSFGSRSRSGGRDGARPRNDKDSGDGRGERDRGPKSRFRREPGNDDGPPAPRSQGGEGGEGRGGRERGPRDRNPSQRRSPEFRSPRGGDRGRSGDRDSNRPRVSAEETQKNTELALAEVDEAIKTLAIQPGINEIKLAPLNSFYRRIQHQKIVDAGFVSQSVGEGASRAVTISRQPV